MTTNEEENIENNLGVDIETVRQSNEITFNEEEKIENINEPNEVTYEDQTAIENENQFENSNEIVENFEENGFVQNEHSLMENNSEHYDDTTIKDEINPFESSLYKDFTVKDNDEITETLVSNENLTIEDLKSQEAIFMSANTYQIDSNDMKRLKKNTEVNTINKQEEVDNFEEVANSIISEILDNIFVKESHEISGSFIIVNDLIDDLLSNIVINNNNNNNNNKYNDDNILNIKNSSIIAKEIINEIIDKAIHNKVNAEDEENKTWDISISVITDTVNLNENTSKLISNQPSLSTQNKTNKNEEITENNPSEIDATETDFDSTLQTESNILTKIEGRKMSINKRPKRKETKVEKINSQKSLVVSSEENNKEKSKKENLGNVKNKSERKQSIPKALTRTTKRMSLDLGNEQRKVPLSRKMSDISENRANITIPNSLINNITEDKQEHQMPIKQQNDDDDNAEDKSSQNETIEISVIQDSITDKNIFSEQLPENNENKTDEKIEIDKMDDNNVKSEFENQIPNLVNDEIPVKDSNDHKISSIENKENENKSTDLSNKLEINKEMEPHVFTETKPQKRDEVEKNKEIKNENKELDNIITIKRRLSLKEFSSKNNTTSNSTAKSSTKQTKLFKRYSSLSALAVERNSKSQSNVEDKQKNVCDIIEEPSKLINQKDSIKEEQEENRNINTLKTPEIEINSSTISDRENNDKNNDNDDNDNKTKDINENNIKEENLKRIEIEENVKEIDKNEYDLTQNEIKVTTIAKEEENYDDDQFEDCKSKTSSMHTITVEIKDEVSEMVEESEILNTEENKPWVVENWNCNPEMKIDEEILEENNRKQADKTEILVKPQPVKVDDIQFELRKKIKTTNYKPLPIENYFPNSSIQTNKVIKPTSAIKLHKVEKKIESQKSGDKDKKMQNGIHIKTIQPLDKSKEQTIPQLNRKKLKEATLEKIGKKKHTNEEIEKNNVVSNSEDLEFRRIKSNIETLKNHIENHKKKPKDYVPFIFNDLQPYGDTNMYERVRNQKPMSGYGAVSRMTAIDLCEPWESYEMDKVILPPIRISSSYIASKSPLLSKRSTRREKSASNIKHSHRSDFIDIHSMKEPSKSFIYSDRKLENQGKIHPLSSRRIEDDYEKTKTDLYRLSLSKIKNTKSSQSKSAIRSALFAYLQNSPGSRRALYEVIHNIDKGNS